MSSSVMRSAMWSMIAALQYEHMPLLVANTRHPLQQTITSKGMVLSGGAGPAMMPGGPMMNAEAAKKMFEEGDMESGVMSAGQIIGLIHDIPSCAELISRIVQEAEAIIQERLARVVGAPVS